MATATNNDDLSRHHRRMFTLDAIRSIEGDENHWAITSSETGPDIYWKVNKSFYKPQKVTIPPNPYIDVAIDWESRRLKVSTRSICAVYTIDDDQILELKRASLYNAHLSEKYLTVPINLMPEEHKVDILGCIHLWRQQLIEKHTNQQPTSFAANLVMFAHMMRISIRKLIDAGCRNGAITWLAQQGYLHPSVYLDGWGPGYEISDNHRYVVKGMYASRPADGLWEDIAAFKTTNHYEITMQKRKPYA